MNRRQIVTVSLIAAGVAVCLPNPIRVLRLAKMTRENKRQYDLDIKAIKTTGDEMSERVRNGEFSGVPSYELDRLFHEQLDFHKIAVREDI